MPAAAKERTSEPDTGLLAPLTQNSHQGHQLSTAVSHPAFGPAISQTPTGLANHLYDFGVGPRCSGYFRDSESGNDYADQRYTSPGMGRFITPDTISGNPSNPGSWNLYAYVAGDPINRADPSGQMWCSANSGDFAGCDGVGPTQSGVCYVLDDLGADEAMLGGCASVVWGDPGTLNGGGGGSPCGGVLAFAGSGCVSGSGVSAAYVPTPLSCAFTGAFISSPGWGYANVPAPPPGSGPNLATIGYYTPVDFYFQASGGSTNAYAWAATQTVTYSGTATYSNGQTVNLSTFPQTTESPGVTSYWVASSSVADLFDAPGIRFSGLGGTIVSANITRTFSLQLTVSNGAQSADCPTVSWSSTEVWLNPNPTAQTGVAGGVTISTIPWQ
jgi:RHS repeat-associated protein